MNIKIKCELNATYGDFLPVIYARNIRGEHDGSEHEKSRDLGEHFKCVEELFYKG